MKLIVGLGNPGKKYQGTRHNLGFAVLDAAVGAEKLSLTAAKKFKAQVAQVAHAKHDKIIFLKPQTYMNLSGEAVVAAAGFYKIDTEEILVIHDDLDLPLGKIRFVRDGGAGGHNGVQSIIESLGTKDFHRLKLGIGRPKHPEQDVTAYVLEKFCPEEERPCAEVLKRAAAAILYYFDHALNDVMNAFNSQGN